MSLKLLCDHVIKAAMWLKSLKSTTNLGFTLTLTWITNDPKLPGDYVIVAKVFKVFGHLICWITNEPKLPEEYVIVTKVFKVFGH